MVIQTATVSPQADRRLVAETLAALSKLDSEQHLGVLSFMEREFGTQLVKGLSASAHKRVRAYASAVMKNKGV